jgi:hypothetical protein
MNSQKPEGLPRETSKKGQSMDDILAQIRRIVSDEATTDAQPRSDGAPPTPRPSQRAPNPAFGEVPAGPAPTPSAQASPDAAATEDRPSLRDRLGFSNRAPETGQEPVPMAEAEAPTDEAINAAPNAAPVTPPVAPPIGAAATPEARGFDARSAFGRRGAAESDVFAPAPEPVPSMPAERTQMSEQDAFDRALNSDGPLPMSTQEPAYRDAPTQTPSISPVAADVPAPTTPPIDATSRASAEPAAVEAPVDAAPADVPTIDPPVEREAPLSPLDRLRSSMSVGRLGAGERAAPVLAPEADQPRAAAATTEAPVANLSPTHEPAAVAFADEVAPEAASNMGTPAASPVPADDFDAARPIANGPEVADVAPAGASALTVDQLVTQAVSAEVRTWLDANMERVVREVVAQDLEVRRKRGEDV